MLYYDVLDMFTLYCDYWYIDMLTLFWYVDIFTPFWYINMFMLFWYIDLFILYWYMYIDMFTILVC
jgi:hypothetical protein